MIGHLKNILKQLKISGLHKTYLPLIVIVAIIFTLTCQEFSPDYAPGLDSSYQWGLNYLFVHDYGTLQQLIYPIGPLAFLKMPTTEGANFAMALIFYLIVKCGFLVLGFKAAGAIDNEGNSNNQFTRWLIPSVFLLAFSYFANIDATSLSLVSYDFFFPMPLEPVMAELERHGFVNKGEIRFDDFNADITYMFLSADEAIEVQVSSWKKDGGSWAISFQPFDQNDLNHLVK